SLPTISPYVLTHLFFSPHSPHLHLHSFPTRRSSDLDGHIPADPHTLGRFPIDVNIQLGGIAQEINRIAQHHLREVHIRNVPTQQDRKSTRLNSSHVAISYAVFCLKKKKDKMS